MSQTTGLSDAFARRLAEAAAWRARLDADGAESCEAFESWLLDPENAQAWARIVRSETRVEAASASPPMLAARASALESARNAARRKRASRRFSRIAAVAAAVVLAAFATLSASNWLLNRPAVYATATAERRVVTLDDGSVISLDAATELRVRYDDDMRRLELVRGQARFDVAHDTSRPFTVKAREQTIVATGTAFNIDLLGPRVLVTLIEGAVTVLNVPGVGDVLADERRTSLRLEPGQQLVVAPAGPAALATASATRATAWETGQIVFENEPLSVAAERVSRYNHREIAADAEAGSYRISGVFRAGDETAFVNAVVAHLPVSVEDGPHGSLVFRGSGNLR